jgi:hypothetical protein
MVFAAVLCSCPVITAKVYSLPGVIYIKLSPGGNSSFFRKFLIEPAHGKTKNFDV